MSFQDLIRRFSPWWLTGRRAGTLLESVGATVDAGAETMVRGFYAGSPLRCEPDALDALGVDRLIRRYPTEPEESYRVRLAEWRQARRLAGSHRGELLALAPYFLPGVRPKMRIVHQSGSGLSATWHTLDQGVYSVYRSIPSNWKWDGVDAKWSRFWVIIYTDGLALPHASYYDEGINFDEGHIYDGLMTIGQIADLVSIVNDQKAAHSILWGVILAKDPASFDPTGGGIGYPGGAGAGDDWGYYVNMTTGTPTRLNSAVYSFDLGHG